MSKDYNCPYEYDTYKILLVKKCSFMGEYGDDD
jgi:hypothetical protein